jgi:hypothetical protein
MTPTMKTKHFFYALLTLVLLTSCRNYDNIRYSKATVFKKKPVAERIEEYDIYVHDDSGKTFRVKEAEVLEGNLVGKTVEIADSTISGDTLNDMHLYLNESEVINPTFGGEQTFSNDNVRYVNMRGTSKATKTKIAFGVLIALLLIPIALIVGVIYLASNSDASSDSQGSDSSSGGCYVATMSYGSYDAPQVLVLREFRDRFLQKFGAGRAFIAWYYRNSPSFVEKHRNKKWLHSALRLPLNALVFILTPFYSGKRAEK